MARGGRVASVGTIAARAPSPSTSTFFRSTARASGSRSMKIAEAAPRDNASSPNAPVPAKASSTTASVNGIPSAAKSPCVRMLNSASRARSLVGLTVCPGGAKRRRPRWLPPTIRMPAGLGRGAVSELLGQHFARHFGNRPARQIAELERPVGEADQPGYQKSQMFEDSPHLAIFSLAQRQRDPSVAALHPVQLRANRAIRDTGNRDALAERR